MNRADEDSGPWVRELRPEDLMSVPGLQGRWRRYLDAPEGSLAMVFGMGELGPAEVAGWHEHPEPELFFVLEGESIARWRESDGSEHSLPLRAGSAFYKRGGTPHQMVNTGGRPFRGVFFKLARQ